MNGASVRLGFPPPFLQESHRYPTGAPILRRPPTNDFKKELFVIKYRVSHDIDRHSDQDSDKNLPRLRTPSFTKEDVDSILVQCHTLSRNSSAGTQNPSYRRRRSRPNSDCNTNADVDDDAQDDHHRQEFRVSSGRRSNSNSKERRISISPSRRSSSKERRISISPSRRSQSPFTLNPAVNRPAKMVSVPPTDKSSNVAVQQPAPVGPVKRIHVKRNVSPARIRVFADDISQDQESSSSREAAHRRKSLVEIDNNAGRSARPRDTKRTRRLSRDLDMNPVPVFEPSPSLSPPSYASLLLEDIQNFHKNTVTTQPAFDLPECVSKACLIMEAVADMNSNTSSLCSDERWRNTAMKKESSGMT
ncbi:uncharacterized protein At1g65710-like [Bidens hawaiensis]|uniref:uncharacterized protein At1g65710-like n=1 Tax=Bidens hawaiensis TaxID=980011 RepID=UPI00404ACB31